MINRPEREGSLIRKRKKEKKLMQVPRVTLRKELISILHADLRASPLPSWSVSAVHFSQPTQCFGEEYVPAL